MSLAEVVGWLAALAAIVLGIPQVVRLVRTRSTAGLSTVAWQASLAICLGWLVHGFQIGALNMIVPNGFGALPAVAVLLLVLRERRLNPVRLFAPVAVVAAGMITVDLMLGSTWYGLVATGAAVVANAGQGVQLVRAPSIQGVAPGFLLVQLANQVLWLGWGFLVNDSGTQIASISTGVIALFNVVWWLLRSAGLRPLFVRPQVGGLVPDEAAQVSCQT
ncbi:MAG: SemiSWEET family transporter [Propionicimonas sp.]